MARNSKRKDGLASKVKTLAETDVKITEEGRYIPFCDYHNHRGIIKREYVCQSRDCIYYKKLKIPNRNI